jgi:transposase
MRLYGMGELTSLVTLCELGDDIGVHRSDRRARVGKLTRQGSPQLRWALYEAAWRPAGQRAPTTPTTSR